MDFSIWAAEQLVGRIYQLQKDRPQWFWGINTVTYDISVGVQTCSFDATSFEDALARFRAAFDVWLQWALAMPRRDAKYPRITAELKKMGLS